MLAWTQAMSAVVGPVLARGRGRQMLYLVQQEQGCWGQCLSSSPGEEDSHKLGQSMQEPMHTSAGFCNSVKLSSCSGASRIGTTAGGDMVCGALVCVTGDDLICGAPRVGAVVFVVFPWRGGYMQDRTGPVGVGGRSTTRSMQEPMHRQATSTGFHTGWTPRREGTSSVAPLGWAPLQEPTSWEASST